MPGIRAKTKPLIARDTPYPPDSRDASRAVRNSGIRGAEEVARGFDNLQTAVNQLLAAARQASPEITEFLVTDGVTGRVLAALGQYEKNGIVTSGGYFSELYAGDPYGNSDPADAIFKVTEDGKVQVGENGWVDVLDPFMDSAAWIGTQFDTLPVTGAVNNGSGLIRLTVTAHTLQTGDIARVLDVGGVPNATGIFTVTSINANTIDLQNSVFVGTYTSGGTIDRLMHVTGAVNNGSGLIRLTVTAHGYESGDKANVQNVGGVPNATGQWIIEVITANTFDLVGSTFAGAFTSGGTSLRYFAGMLAQTFAIGDSFPDYKLRAFANGDLRIRNAVIELIGAGGTITLDPDVPEFKLDTGSFTVTINPTDSIKIDDSNFITQLFAGSIRTNSCTLEENPNSPFGGRLILENGLGQQRILLDGSAGDVELFGPGQIARYRSSATEGMGVPPIYASVNLLNQTAGIGATNLQVDGSIAFAGLYRVNAYLWVQVVGTGGSIDLTISWNDGTAARTWPVIAPANSLAGFSTISGLPIYTNGAGNITYTVVFNGVTGNPQYGLQLALERLN